MGARKLNNKLNIISKNVKKYREEKGLSQPDLCRELALIGVTMYNSDVYEIEYGLRTVKDYEVYAIAKVLKITLEQLYSGCEKEFNL